MSRQFRHAATASRPGGPGPTGAGSRGVGRAGAAVLATALLLGWTSTAWPDVARAQQSPDAWNRARRAVLPSGLAVELEFSPAPGVSSTAAPGRLAARTGSGHGATLPSRGADGGKSSVREAAASASVTSGYADGLRPGDPAETFEITERHPRSDGSWHTLGTLRLSFSRVVRNPRLHLSGLAGVATGKGGSTATRLTVTGGAPGTVALIGRTDWPGWTVGGDTLAPSGDGLPDGAADGLGTLELAGTVSTVTFRVERRSTARSGGATAPAAPRHAYTVTLDEGLGTAPQGYGNASHLVSDLFLGRDASGGSARTLALPPAHSAQPLVRPGPGDPGEPEQFEDVPAPLIAPDRDTSRRGPFASPVPPRRRPGRNEYGGGDPTVSFPDEAAVGRPYEVTVPVEPGSRPATLVGWIDFGHSGHFDAAGRVQTTVPAGSTSATLQWTVPGNAASGDTWARLRIARDPAQLIGPGGFADSGQVLDRRIRLTVGAPRAEDTAPLVCTAVAGTRPENGGDGAVAGAAVAVVEGEAARCGAKAVSGVRLLPIVVPARPVPSAQASRPASSGGAAGTVAPEGAVPSVTGAGAASFAGGPQAPGTGGEPPVSAPAAAPGLPEPVAAHRTGTGGWRSGLWAGLLFLAAAGLLIRRALTGGSGSRLR
ncbi:GEVED domain-containing protein [Kitasatospora sp. HPMI-4]|uniref:GEVED domain-containing protein n=1 Tax=Kitasatospora sp. HPMI-4 TaxID=3448443 RepID=UPI003F1984F9